MIENKQEKGCCNCFWGQNHWAVDTNQLNNIYFFIIVLLWLMYEVSTEPMSQDRTKPQFRSKQPACAFNLGALTTPEHSFPQFHSKLFIRIQVVVVIDLCSSLCVSFRVCLFRSAQKFFGYRWFSYQFEANGAIILSLISHKLNRTEYPLILCD